MFSPKRASNLGHLTVLTKLTELISCSVSTYAVSTAVVTIVSIHLLISCSLFIFLSHMLYPHLVSIVPMVLRHTKIGLQVVPPTGPGPRPVSEAKNDQHWWKLGKRIFKEDYIFIFVILDWFLPPSPHCFQTNIGKASTCHTVRRHLFRLYSSKEEGDGYVAVSKQSKKKLSEIVHKLYKVEGILIQRYSPFLAS